MCDQQRNDVVSEVVPMDRWERRLKPNEINAILEFMSRGQLHATEAFPFVQLQARLRELLADEEGAAQ